MLRTMSARLYGVPASHPVLVVEKALQLKGVPYERVHLVPVFHKLAQKVRFGGSTVPGIVFEDGRKLQGSRDILRALEDLEPQPPLWPADPADRAQVEAAEEWGERVLQPLVRRVLWTALGLDTSAQSSYTEGLKLTPPVPAPMARLSGRAVAWAEKRINKASTAGVRADLRDLPRHLDRIDGWLEEGVLGGETVNAADLQIASSLRLLATVADLAPVIDARQAGAFARRVLPTYQGGVPKGTLPAEWLPVLSAV